MASGIERMQVQFGLETDKGRRFAMWSLLYMLGSAPDFDIAFKDERDRDAARRAGGQNRACSRSNESCRDRARGAWPVGP